MRKIIKPKTLHSIAFIAIAAIIGFSAAACDNGTVSNSYMPYLLLKRGKTPLATPSNVRVDHAGYTQFNLAWNAVEGADSYTVDIDGVLYSVSTTSYNLRALTQDPRVYPIKVRAVAYNGDPVYSDSAYSAALNVEPAEFIFLFEGGLPLLSVQHSRSAGIAAGGKTISGLTAYGKTLEKVIIPRQIRSVDITSIGQEAFKNEETMTEIILPDTIITIGASAFSGTGITDITIPDSVTAIGNGAFSNCIVLVYIVFIPVDPPQLGEGAIPDNEGMTIVVPPASREDYEDILPEEIEIIEAEKVLLRIEVTQQPAKTSYTVGENFSVNGMIVKAYYSNNTNSTITTYTVLLRSNTGSADFGPNRPLVINDTTVRISYTEDGITRTADIAVTVQEITYEVTFNANGGSFNNGTSTKIISVQAGGTINPGQVENPTRNNYSFTGWRQSGQSSDFNFNSPITGSITLNAQWQQISSGGTFILTNIPSDRNGKYILAYFYSNNADGDDFMIIGAQNVNLQTETTTSVQITNGQAVIPLWLISKSSSDEYSMSRYNGNDTLVGYVELFNTGTSNIEDMPLETRYFESIIFNNGNATKSWTDGEEGGVGPYPVNLLAFDANEGYFSSTGDSLLQFQIQGGQTIPTSIETPNPPQGKDYTFAGWFDAYGEQFDPQVPIFSGANYERWYYARWTTSSGTVLYNARAAWALSNSGHKGGTISFVDSDGSSRPILPNIQAGTPVNINVYPEQGYTLSSLYVKWYPTGSTGGGGEITLYPGTGLSNQYSFTMPAYDVVVISFFEDNGSGTGGGDDKPPSGGTGGDQPGGDDKPPSDGGTGGDQPGG